MKYDPSLQWAVLELLATWKRLPLGDLERMLQPIEQLRFRRELLDDMEYDGLVILRQAGDTADPTGAGTSPAADATVTSEVASSPSPSACGARPDRRSAA